MKQKVRLSFTANVAVKVTVKVIKLIPRLGVCVYEVREFRPGEIDKMLLFTPDKYEALSYFESYISKYI